MADSVRNSLFLIVALLLANNFSSYALGEVWRSLLDEDLDRWQVWLGAPEESVKVPGRPDDAGNAPIGSKDPLNVFTILMHEGEPVLNITGEVYGGITTLEEFGDYHLTLEFRWKDKKCHHDWKLSETADFYYIVSVSKVQLGAIGCNLSSAKSKRTTVVTTSH